MATCQSNRVVGYARVSTSDQNTSMQLRAFERAGVLEVHEEQMSAVKSRPVLDQLLAGLKRGDTLVVYKLDRLARSMTQFVRVFEDLRVRGIEFRSLTESLKRAHLMGACFCICSARLQSSKRADSGALSGWSESCSSCWKNLGAQACAI